MIRRPPRSTLDRSSAASDVYKRQRIRSPRRSESCVNADRYVQLLGQCPIRLHLRVIGSDTVVYQTQFTQNAEPSRTKILAEYAHIRDRKIRAHHGAADNAPRIGGVPA